MKSMEEYRSELKGWKITALRLSANGRFKGYEPGFIAWLDELDDTLKNSRTTTVTYREYQEARRRVDALNDDYFPEICDRIERVLSFADDMALAVDQKALKEFEKYCAEHQIDPGAKISDLIRLFLGESGSSNFEDKNIMGRSLP